MIPQTVGAKYDAGKVAKIHCIKNDKLEDLNIKNKCYLLMIVFEGSVSFKCKNKIFEAEGPCFVCFDETENPKLIKQKGLKCNSIYFNPEFLNINMSFERIRREDYEHLALMHDMFLLKPFTDSEKFVYLLFEEYISNLSLWFDNLEEELKIQRDWYWSCRSRSYFMEIILLLERVYGIIETKEPKQIKKIKNKHLKSALIYIESHYNKSITLEDITTSASMNHTSLTKIFKEELNTTPMDYFWKHRISVAKKHLEFTNLPVKDISIRCGFKTVQHFTRKFEQYMGVTPVVFRKNSVKERKSAF